MTFPVRPQRSAPKAHLRRGTGAALLVSALALAAPAVRAAEGEATAVPPDDVMGTYLADLEKSGRLPAEAASLELLRSRLHEAEDKLIHGDARAATTALYAIVESPRYAPWKDTPEFQDCEYVLGRALLRGGAIIGAERYLMRVLARGPTQPYYVAAHRSMVDLALETRTYGRVLAKLESTPVGGALPDDSEHERYYLRGRQQYAGKDLDGAASTFARVGRLSRLYPAAAYFRALIAARRGAYADARGALCELVPRKDGDPLAFNIDGRYFSLQDLARLALARLAHEQDHYDEAYYFYFSIPEESERLAEALFEAAWSMYQKGEQRSARAFVDEFDRAFPLSALRPEVHLLRANIAIKSCAFDSARAESAALVTTYGPLQSLASKAIADPVRRRGLVERLLTRPSPSGPGVETSDEDGRLLSLLKLDDRFTELHTSLRQLDSDLAEARMAVTHWHALGEAAAGAGSLGRAASSPEAAQLLDDVVALVPLAEDAPELAGDVETLLLKTSIAAYPTRPAGPYAAEELAARGLVADLAALRLKVKTAAQELAAASFRELDDRLRALFRQARLVDIDAVVGRKKKLELEISNLQAGRFSADIYAKLKTEGALGDDEEYWPFEGESWADEYENYR